MWFRKNRRISELERNVESIRRTLKETKLELWEVKNPPKFEVGQSVKKGNIDGIIISSRIDTYELYTAMFYNWEYRVFDKKTKSIINLTENELSLNNILKKKP